MGVETPVWMMASAAGFILTMTLVFAIAFVGIMVRVEEQFSRFVYYRFVMVIEH